MKHSCPSGKQSYFDENQAIAALLDLWSRIDFKKGQGPVTVYCCEDCGNYHFTSSGSMHPRLDELLKSGNTRLTRTASEWEKKLR
jgi:hypothetical protein